LTHDVWKRCCERSWREKPVEQSRTPVIRGNVHRKRAGRLWFADGKRLFLLPGREFSQRDRQAGRSIVKTGDRCRRAFDSVQGSPGADDNASGVAVLLETARVLSKTRLRSQILFCAFQLEEFNMIGSRHFARKLKKTGARVDAMMSLEMIGYTDSRPGSQKYPAGLGWLYPDRGDFIGVISNWNSNSLARNFAQSLRQVDGLLVETLSLPGNGALVPAASLSDHAPFWDLGFPALLITDTAFLRNPNYHRASDSLETLNMNFMTKVCEGVIRGVLGL
jgi:hypothetical protein